MCRSVVKKKKIDNYNPSSLKMAVCFRFICWMVLSTLVSQIHPCRRTAVTLFDIAGWIKGVLYTFQGYMSEIESYSVTGVRTSKPESRTLAITSWGLLLSCRLSCSKANTKMSFWKIILFASLKWQTFHKWTGDSCLIVLGENFRMIFLI